MKRDWGSDASADDASLLARLNDDPGALEDFYRRHVPGVTRYLARRCATPHDVADAVSATFLSVLISSSSYVPQLGSPTAWLYSIAANAAKRQSRTQVRDAALYDRVKGTRFLTANNIERLLEMIDAERQADQIGPLVARAPEGEQVLLEIIVNDEVPTAQAARSLGITESTARKRLSRLRSRVNPDQLEGVAAHQQHTAIEEDR